MSQPIQEISQSFESIDQTGAVPTVEDRTGALSAVDQPEVGNYPPSGAWYYASHDVRAEATESPVLEYDPEAEVIRGVISTPLTVSDATIAIRGLRHPDSTLRLRRDYSEELRQRTYDKTKAVVDVLIADSMPSTMQAYDAYERMRTGRPQPVGVVPVVKSKTEMQAFTEKPLAPVGEESLALEAEEYHVVLDGLRIMAASANDRYERLEAMDLLSRMTPSQGEKALYTNLLKGSGINLNVRPQPQYNAGADSLIQ